jgi:hypothetical protein
MQEALGEAFSEMFEFDKAVDYYQLAIKNKNSAASIKSIEQLANCRIRLAVRTLQTDPGYYKTAKSTIRAQIAELRRLIKTLGETAERWSMVGSGYKRLAQISSSRSVKACDEALKEMEIAYEHARASAEEDPYPLTNALVAKVILLLRSRDLEKMEPQNNLTDLFKLKEEAAGLADIARGKSPDDFWASIGVTDVRLVAYMLDYLRDGPKKIDDTLPGSLVEEYRETWNRFGSAREFNSVIEQYAFLLAMLNGIEQHKIFAGSLTEILSSLNSIVD